MTTAELGLANRIEGELAKAGEKGLIPPFIFSTSEVAKIIRALRAPAPASGVTEEWVEAMPVDQWPIEIDEDVLIYVVHPNAQYEPDEARRKEEWECWCVGRWIEHNKGGWTWHGMSGTVTHVAPLPARPAPIRGERGTDAAG